MNAELRDNLLAAEPVGSLHYYIRAATTAETLINGFALEGNGVQVLRSVYAALNTLLNGLGYPFGSGNGSTTLTLPDIQGRMLVAMASAGHADVDALGDSDGLAKASRSPKHNTSVLTQPGFTGSLGTTGTESADHTHTVNAHNHGPVGGYNTGAGTGGSGLGGGDRSPEITGNDSPGTSGRSAAHTHQMTPAGTLSGGAYGPGGTRPNDLAPWLIAGVWAVKV
jgi:hypothetical protein